MQHLRMILPTNMKFNICMKLSEANVFPVKVINSILKDTQHSQPQPQQSIRRYDYNNGITNIVHEHGHHIHWNQAKVVATEQY